MKSANEWPAAHVEMRAVSSLVPYARNSRTHSDEQVDQIVASMREWGWTNPVLVDEAGMIIAGHGRILAAQKLGILEAPVMTARGWTENQKRAYVLADNKLALNAGWDMATLTAELGDLKGFGFDLAKIGFSGEELAAMSATKVGLADPDAVPKPPARAVSVLGDVWLLGGHRLVCGDSTDPAVVARLMDGAQAALMFTSPPYAQQRDYGAAKEKVGDWDALMQGVFATAPVNTDSQLLVNLGLVHRDGEWVPYWEGWLDWMRAQGWRRFGWYVWDQGPGLPGDWNGRLAPSHEFIFHFNRQPRKPNKTVESKHAGETLGGGGLRGADGTVHRKTGTGNAIQSHRIPDSIFRIMRHKGGLGAAGSHPAVFPVALVEAVLEAFTDPGDLVFEPFCGSGTQLIAAERTGRRCCAIELNPIYVDVAVKRWQDFTGKVAVIESTGQSFEDVADGRYDFRKDGLGSWEQWCAAKREELVNARPKTAA